MKNRLVKLCALTLAILTMILSLTACATRLKGTYVSDGIIEQTLTFEDDDVIVISAFDINAEGTYAIEDDTIIITYSLLNLSYDWELSFEKDGDTITIDGVEFVKVK